MTRTSAAAWTMVLAVGLVASTVACAAHELPVVATGRWVELASSRDEPICGGTLDFLDATVGAAFEVLGEAPPDEVFIRYEWLPEPEEQVSLSGEGFAREVDEGILIRTDQLIHEHELVHAAQFTAWPRAARFMEEGLAVLLDSRRIQDKVAWPDGLTLDEIFESSLEGGHDYVWAWFVVSQIVHDHGFDGLRELWPKIPHGASAQEVRAAYEATFGQSIDVLLEPHRGPIQYNGFELAGQMEERYPCVFSLCPGSVTVFGREDDVALAPGPSGCQDDPNAIGPHSRNAFIDGPPVWRETTVELEQSPAIVGETEVLHGLFRPCALMCFGQGNGIGLWVSPSTDEDHRLIGGRRWRVEARAELDALPTDDPGAIAIYPYSE